MVFGSWVLSGALLARSAPRRPMTIDDLIGAVRVADPQLSPDGSRVASRPDDDRSEDRASATPTSGSCRPTARRRRRQLIGGDKSETTPRFSPDGKRIAFISTRDGGAAGLRRRRRRQQRRRSSRASRWACSRRSSFSPDGIADRVRVGRLPGVPRTRPATSGRARGREEPGEGAPPDAAALPALGRMARERPSPRVRRGRRAADGRSTHARRLRLAAGAAGRRRDRVLARRTRDRVRVEPRRGRPRSLDDEPRRLDRAGRRRRGEEADDATRRPTCSRSFSPDGRDALRARAAACRASSPIAGISTPTIARRGAKRTVFTTPDLSVGDYALSPDGAIDLVHRRRRTGATTCSPCPAAGGAPKRVVQGGAISAARARTGLRRVLEDRR